MDLKQELNNLMQLNKKLYKMTKEEIEKSEDMEGTTGIFNRAYWKGQSAAYKYNIEKIEEIIKEV